MFRRRRDTTVPDDKAAGGPVYPAQRPMYGVTRATMTLLGAAVAGFLIWLVTQINDHKTGGYWAVYGLIAAAGLVMALSQLLGGWTKWGFPRLSANVFLLAFIPVLVVAGWVIVAGQPHPNWLRNHIVNWSGDIHIRGLVNDLKEYIPVLAFGIGLVFGYTFDTSGPRLERPGVTRRRETTFDREVADEPTAAERASAATASSDGVADRHLTGTRSGARGTPVAPQPEPGPEPAPRTTRDLE
jgi:hypothetical protein